MATLRLGERPGFGRMAVLTLAPVIVQHAELKPPVFDLAYAKLAVASYIVFLVFGAVVFAIKKLVLKLIG